MTNNASEIIQKVSEHFGTLDTVPDWKTFILPNGNFLDMHNVASHAFIEQWLINNGLSEEKFAPLSDGSPTLSRLGCFRCNPKGHYCILPDVEFPTDESLNSLLLWLDKQSSETDRVFIIDTNGKTVTYNFNDYSTDDIIGRIERYYSSGVLYEKQIQITRACGVNYKRGRVSEKLSLEKADNDIREQKEREFLNQGGVKARYIRMPICEKLNRFGFTLKDIQKKAKKQSANKKNLGWFETFGGYAPVENAFFNMAMGSADGIAGEGSPDGGIGTVGAMGEGYETEESTATGTESERTDWLDRQIANLRKTKEGDFYWRALKTYPNFPPELLKTIYEQNPSASVDDMLSVVKAKEAGGGKIDNSHNAEINLKGKPLMENKEKYTFSLGDGESFDVDKDKIKESLFEMMSIEPSLIDVDDNKIRTFINEKFDALVNKYYDKLYNQFHGNTINESCSCEDEEDVTKDKFYGLNESDPEVKTEKREKIGKSFFEDWEDEDGYSGDEDRYEMIKTKTVLDADGFTTDYTLYYDAFDEKYITIFGDRDFYSPEDTYSDAEFDTREEALEWFDSYTGFEDEDFDECIHKEVYLPSFNENHKETDPYAERRGKIDDDCTEVKFPERKHRELKHDDNPMTEGVMSDLDIERQEDEELADKLEASIKALRDELKFLKEQAPKEIRKGGAFDSQEEINDAIASTERELRREEAKLKILAKAKNMNENKRLHEADENVDIRELFKEFMEESGMFDKDGTYTIYADYKDRFDAETVAEILDSSDPLQTVEEMLFDFDDSYDRDYIMSEFDEFLRKRGIEDADYTVSDVDDLFYISQDTDHYLGQEYQCRIVVDTGDSNYDFALNPSYANDYLGNNGENGDNEIGEPASLVWLAKTQGYSVEQLRKALEGDDQGSKFLKSVYEEAQNTTSSMNALVILCNASLDEMIKQKEDNLPITVNKAYSIGLYDGWAGGGSILGIEIEKPFTIPAEYIREFVPDVRTDSYSVDEVYGLTGKAYSANISIESTT